MVREHSGTGLPILRGAALRMRRAARGAGIAAVVALTSACGVPVDDRAVVVKEASTAWPTPSRASTSASPESTAGPERLYFIDHDGALVAQRAIGASGQVGPDAVLAALLSGPSASGLATALSPDTTIRLDEQSGDLLTVSWFPGDPAPPADRITKGAAQIVLSLTSVPGIRWIQFVRDGGVVGVPGPRGNLLTGPFRAADFLDLTTPPTAAPS